MPNATAIHHASNTLLAVADSSAYTTVEGNVYFAPSSLLLVQKSDTGPCGLEDSCTAAITSTTHLAQSNTHTTCGWKGKASYYNLVFHDKSMVCNIGWFYPDLTDKAEHIKDFVAWYKNKVEVRIMED